jgi:hypothetical protein
LRVIIRENVCRSSVATVVLTSGLQISSAAHSKGRRMTFLKRLLRLLFALGLLCTAAPSFADGLIFSLPADGTWVEYSGKLESNFKMDLPPEVLARMDAAGKIKMQSFLGPQKMHQTVRVSSVGSDKYDDKPCRWIELAVSVTPDAEVKPKQDRKLQLKLLIPETDLTRGSSPLESSYLTFFNPKQVDIAHVPTDPGFDRIRYEIERVFNCFPPPLKEEKQLPTETITTPIGTFNDCEVIRGKAQFDRPLMSGGRWTQQATWTIALHPDAPFGVVRIKSEGSNEEIPSAGPMLRGSMIRELALSAKGEKAVSELPEGKRKRVPLPNSR